MSYNLYFRSRRPGSEPTWEEFRSYFEERDKYCVSETEAFYENEATGVYFSFQEHDVEKSASSHVDVRGDRPYLELLPVTFTMNYFRPHIFGLEAECELSPFIEHFNLLVYDPQVEGMTDGIYTPQGFLKGWNSGNDFSYSALFSASYSTEIFALPTEKIEVYWRWNMAHRELEGRYEERGLFIPKIWYVYYRRKVCSVVAWAEGIELALPMVDLILTTRTPSKLAGMFGAKAEQIMLKMSDLLPKLDGFERADDPHEHLLIEFGGDAAKAQQELAKLFQGKHPTWGELRRIPHDRILNEEIVERYLGVKWKR